MKIVRFVLESCTFRFRDYIRLSVKVIMLYIFVLFKEVLLSLIEQEYVVRRIQSYVQTI